MLESVNGFNKYLGLDFVDETSLQALKQNDLKEQKDLTLKLDEKLRKIKFI